MSLGRKIEVISEDHIQSRESCVIWESLMKVMEELKGKANQELIKFLSSLLGVSKNSLSIEKGMTGKKKTVAVRGLGQDQVLGLLEKYRTH